MKLYLLAYVNSNNNNNNNNNNNTILNSLQVGRHRKLSGDVTYLVTYQMCPVELRRIS